MMFFVHVYCEDGKSYQESVTLNLMRSCFYPFRTKSNGFQQPSRLDNLKGTLSHVVAEFCTCYRDIQLNCFTLKFID